jgi:Mrp family chromosome partitioning ATPase
VPGLLDRRLLVVTGKGGVGKTTVAAALGILAARRGARTIVAEVGGRGDAARLLAGSGVQHLSISPQAAMEEYLRDQLPSRTVAATLARSGMFSAFVSATPGMHELLSIGKVWELTQDERRSPGEAPYDLVVLDAPSSGHGLAMLSAPRTFSEAARVGPIHRQAGIIDATLADGAHTAVIAVALAEEMPVNETLELRRALVQRLGRDLDAVVANGLVPDRFTTEQARALEADGSPAARAALWAHRRARAQRGQLRRLRAGLAAPPVRLPFVFAPELGPATVGELAGALERLA